MKKSVPEPIARVAELLSVFPDSWYLIGGWAVDSWLGRQSREHPDVDVGLSIEDQTLLFDYLPDWHLVAHDPPEQSHDDRWDGRSLEVAAHVHARHADWPFELDFNFNERVGDRWLMSREPHRDVVAEDAVRESPWGVPTLSPELVLWHKGSGEIRERDQVDFEALEAKLEERQREWLALSLAAIDRQHPWLSRLKP